jgi:hypothetical protein
LSDEALEAKFLDLVTGILTPARARRLLDTCWNVEKLPSAAAIVEAAIPAHD